MNSRERVLTALNHKEPDQIPYDLAGTILSGMNIHFYKNLRKYLGLPEPDDYPIIEILQQLGGVHEDVIEILKPDVSDALPRSSGTFEIVVRDMAELGDPKYTYFYDEWGIGWRMPKEGGLYYDMFYHPLEKAETIEEIDNFAWPDPVAPGRFEGLRERAKYVAEVEQKAVALGGLSAGIIEMCAWLRGYEEFYPDTILNVPMIERIADIVMEMKMAFWERVLEEVGEYADVIMEADDFSGQHRLLFSLETYQTIFKPRHKKLFEFIRERSDGKIFFHSCGAVREAIPDLIDAGVQILNPVQVGATGMDSADLKREFGRDLSFWGGAVDVQYVFDQTTPEKVREETLRRIHDLAPGGGWICANIHNIQATVPPENFMAFWETLQDNIKY
jgi:uroporphyrinogen decarboxylase